MIKNKERFYSIILGAIITIAVIIRAYLFLINKSLWLDEAALGLNLLEKSFFGLFEPLRYAQSAPPFFLMLSKLSMTIFGKNEWALRLLPFISSICSVFAFKYLLDLIFKNPLIKAIPLILFAFSFPLLYNTIEFKPYSTDVLFTVLTLIICIRFLSKDLSRKKEILLGLLLAIFPLFSFGSIFAITTAIIFSLINKKKIMPAIITVGLLIEYFFIFSHLGAGSSVFQWWYPYFINHSFSKIFLILIKIFQYHFHPSPLLLIPFVLFFTGSVYMFKENKKLCLLFLTPLILGLGTSFFNLYPLFDRLSLFLYPIFAVLIVYPLQTFKKSVLKNTTLVFLIIFILSFFNQNLLNPNLYKREEIKPLIKVLQKEIQKDDKVFVFKDSHLAYRFYDPKLKYDNKVYITGPKDDPYKKLDSFCKASSCFIVFTTEINRKTHRNNLDNIVNNNGGKILHEEDSSVLYKAVFK